MSDRSFIILSTVFIIALVAFGSLSGGCSKGGTTTSPEAAAKAFVAALRSGDYAKAANMMAWDDIARQQNPDWDSFPSSQRSLIIGKLKEQMQSSLAQLAGRVQGAQVGNVSVSGDTAQATAGSLTIVLKKTAEGWKVLSAR